MSYDDEWFGNCANTFHEEQKQIVYAKRMGLIADWTVGHPPVFDVGGHSIIDIGGGPVSLLLKCVNHAGCVVLDPGQFPPWVAQRYEQCGVMFWNGKAEEIDIEGSPRFDEAWIYNVLQHVEDPEHVINNARTLAETIRLFEWIGIDPYPGHPHRLEVPLLEGWLGSKGFASHVNEDGAVGYAFYGVFAGKE